MSIIEKKPISNDMSIIGKQPVSISSKDKSIDIGCNSKSLFKGCDIKSLFQGCKCDETYYYSHGNEDTCYQGCLLKTLCYSLLPIWITPVCILSYASLCFNNKVYCPIQTSDNYPKCLFCYEQ